MLMGCLGVLILARLGASEIPTAFASGWVLAFEVDHGGVRDKERRLTTGPER